MFILRPCLAVGLAAMILAATPPRSMSQSVEIDPAAAKHWDDYNHYVRIALPGLAAGSAGNLMNMVNDEQLLAVVEAGDYADYETSTFLLAAKIETLRDVTGQLAGRIQAARIAQSRDPERIAADIALLAGTQRQRHNAILRLRAAGQIAAPQLLDVLNDEDKAKLVPHVLTAMVELGKPLVYPLSEALLQLEPVQMGQVAQVLANIGYPRALPYIKQVLERSETDEHSAKVLQVAFDLLTRAANTPADISASELFLRLGHKSYDAGTKGKSLPGYDPATDEGIIWTYTPRTGLAPTRVPATIFADVATMHAAERALELDPLLDQALSLWLASNLRRENRLEPGQIDPSHTKRHKAMYYAVMAGPLRLHDVLNMALEAWDTELALDAINALQATAGTDALINHQGATQPLITAISYPDRRVRFNAAYVMTQTRPTDSFDGSHRVVSVLAEAARQTEQRHALALGRDQDTTNRLVVQLGDLDYRVLSGTSLDQVIEAVNAGPGIDLIVIDLGATATSDVIAESLKSYKLAGVPILALGDEAGQASLALQFKDSPRLHAAVRADAAETLRGEVEQAAAAMAGAPISADEADVFAATALRLLREVALGSSPTYDVTDAEPTLIAALKDKREQMVVLAGRVLELIDTQQSQLAIAQAALDIERAQDVRISLLGNLAQSTKQFGNKLGRIQNDRVLELVRTADGELATAAAAAHGAMTLPTANAVKLIAGD